MIPAKFDLSVETISIGRTDDNDVVLPHPTVPRRHARIVHTGDVFYFEDLNTANGSWVNDERVAPLYRVPLSSGDKLRIGQFTREFSIVEH
jgi:pSer/pThr/pTyr-binding forkhead associated (FHA) protein